MCAVCSTPFGKSGDCPMPHFTADLVCTVGGCQKKSKTKRDAVRHARTHTKAKPFKCNECDAAFAASSNLATHKRIHARVKPFKCDVCGAAFTQQNNLVRHKRTHTGEKPFKCDICGSTFTQMSGLTSHMRTHTGEKPFECDICGTKFAQSSALVSHKRTHTGEKPFKCDVCKAAFPTSSNLTVHKRTHTGEKPFKCDICGATFADSGNLASHNRVHTGEKPFKCDICGTMFAHSNNLASHKRTHTGEKPFKCNVCSAAFTHSSTLANHKRTHTGEKPFKCDVCGVAFAQSCNLVKHKRFKHNIGLLPCFVCLEDGRVKKHNRPCDDCKAAPEYAEYFARSKRGKHEIELFDKLLEYAEDNEELTSLIENADRDVFIPCSGAPKGNHRPDILLPVSSTYAVVIEIDEHAHSGYDKTCERARQDRIHNTLFTRHGINCITFIRYNPHAKGNLAGEVYEVLEERVEFGESMAERCPTLINDVFIGYSEKRIKELQRIELEMREEMYKTYAVDA